MFQLPNIYQQHLKNQFNLPQYLTLYLLLNLLQNLKTIRLEEIARRFPYPIKLRSRVKKLQRFLSLKQWNINQVWFPIIKQWILQQWHRKTIIYLVIDRTQWGVINLLMVSLIYHHRAIPIYFQLLNKKGSSNFQEQKEVLAPSLNLLKDYKIVVLGDREFCSVDLAKWLLYQGKVYFALRLKKNEYIQISEIWTQLNELYLCPGMSCYYQGVKVTKSKGFTGASLVGKWRRKYRHKSSKEPWFLLTNLKSLPETISAYKKRMGIEEMFRDFKLGGYNLESTKVEGDRLIALLIIITLAYSWSTFSGEEIKRKGISEYLVRPKEKGRSDKRYSDFSIGFNGLNFLQGVSVFEEQWQELTSLFPQKSRYYRQGMRAIRLIQSAF
ncbi:IS4 family transposase [Cyanobacterium aponinum AL20118]|uniref:IS4 family transposase n=1 Tax=Cyanobacterium aponinum AL20115 TaxID=3090662 RepID=A0AAF0ZE08_9CHRO|nr:IS4 family transposase [Cyanobacterium aponinum]WPF87251.1 IS4 family transposase [Cyanobacterium aponinum AL20115]WPF88603.1 IS4 family transposase [Cyanobacterium aponinum AL20115]